MSDTPDLTPENTAPKEIFLQDAGDYESASQFEVTWCVDPQDDADTKYIRADLHEAERARADKAEAERDVLAGKLAKVTAAYRIEAMRRGNYSHEAFDRHIASITGGGND